MAEENSSELNQEFASVVSLEELRRRAV